MTSESHCLSQVPFSITLPSTFQDGDNFPPLPPSYRYDKREGLQDLKILVVKYQLHFIVTRVRHQKLQDIWLKKQQYVYLLTSVSLPFINFLLSIIIPFTYAPRTRAQRPIVATPCFFSSVKTSPEEWHQAITCLEMRPSEVKLGSIICHVCYFKDYAPGF